MNNIADTAGYILVYPKSIQPRWNANCNIPGVLEPNVNDIGFISALIDTLYVRYNVAMNRIYCCGLNYGGWMASELICQIGHRFAAGARVNTSLGDNQAARCTSARSFPIVLFNGTADKVLPWPDGKAVMGGEEAISWWVERNSCSLSADTVSLPDLDETDSCTVDKISYLDCSEDAVVIFYKVIDGGISWPGAVGNETWDRPRNNDINAGVEILNFFDNFENPLTGIEPSKNKQIPLNFMLIQNYPNPFNPSTSIEYTLAHAGHATLRIHNVLGEEVAILVDGALPAGTFTTTWDASNMPSGVYFYRLTAGEYVQTRKMVLMK